MANYVVPIFDKDEIYIESVIADSYTSAKDKMINKIVDNYSLDYPIDWNDFIELCNENEILVGEIKDVELI